ncbi:diphthine--ammonia ligase [Methanosarcinales archaeon]|nr:MAG: diphthine--ammonia ligase [Methanosarcinales archaeon]
MDISNDERLGVLFSSGKDSAYAAYLMQKQGYKLVCLITVKSRNPYSYMFHTPGIDLVPLQAEAMNLPILEQDSEGVEEIELWDLKEVLEEAVERYGISGVVTGAIASIYQGARIERVCSELGLRVFSPLWHMKQEDVMKSLLRDGFVFIFTSVAAQGLDSSWLGKRITEDDVDKLVELGASLGINVAGEGGEFESLVLDSPLFTKQVEICRFEVERIDEHTAKIVILDARLGSK